MSNLSGDARPATGAQSNLQIVAAGMLAQPPPAEHQTAPGYGGGSGGRTGQPPELKPRPSPVGRDQMLLLIVVMALISGVMTLVANIALLPGSGPLWVLKIVLISAGASIAYYILVHTAAVKWAVLAACGYTSAAIAALAMILFLGSALAVNNASGLLQPSVTRDRYSEHEQGMAQVLAATNRQKHDEARIASNLRAIKGAGEIDAADEAQDGKFTRKIGRGEFGRLIAEPVRRAEALLAEFSRSEKTRADLLQQAQRLLGEYRSRLAKGDAIAARGDLQSIDSRFRDVLVQLGNVTPGGSLQQYLAYLERGVVSARYPDAAAAFNKRLAASVADLKAALAETPRTPMPPAFPNETSIGDVMGRIGSYAPVTSFVFAVDVLVPLLFFLVVFFGTLKGVEDIHGRRPGWFSKNT